MTDRKDLPLYGLDKELADREAAKRDPALEAAVAKFMTEISGDMVTEDVMGSLRDGVKLVKAVNAVFPGALKVNESAMPFKQMENIANFLRACRDLFKMPEHELFTTPDLYDGKSPVNVVNGIVAFSRAAARCGYRGEIIGPKESRATLSESRRPSKWTAKSGAGDCGAVNKWNMGSSQVMDKPHIDKSRDITFGHDVLSKKAP